MPASSPWLAALLAALAAIGPFAIDTYLPAFPAIAQDLSATQLEVQQTLTAYMATFAVMVLWHGALSDRFGRRRVIIATLLLFAAASMVCALATSIEWLWTGRALQGLSGGAGMVVGRAIIRDLFDGPQAQRLMSRVMMIFALAPAVAPLIGGVLVIVAGWRSIFVFLALFAGVLAWLSARWLPETLPPAARQSLHPVSLARAYARVLSSGAFLLLAGTVALNFNGFFLYVLSAPVFVMQHLGLGPGEFAWLFVPAVTGLVAGAMVSGRVAGRWSPQRTIATGFAVMIAAALANVAHAALFAPGVPGSVLPIALYTFGMSIAMPSVTLLALGLFPQRRGLVSSCQSFLQVGVNSLTAGVIAPLVWTTPLSLAAAMGVFLGLGVAVFVTWRVTLIRPQA
jgi:DHA1 family bicyclomycin/chloramphenicol resistance-like MFS transporter